MFKRILTLFIALAMVLVAMTGAFAATGNPSPASSGYQAIIIPVNNITAAGTLTAQASFKMPWPATVVYATTYARASSGTTPTLTLNLKSSTNSMFASACSVVASTVTECTLSTTNVTLADESTITVDSVAGGTTPTFTDITFVVWVKRQ
jgi:Flp pilus assembly protein CpaB